MMESTVVLAAPALATVSLIAATSLNDEPLGEPSIVEPIVITALVGKAVALGGQFGTAGHEASRCRHCAAELLPSLYSLPFGGIVQGDLIDLRAALYEAVESEWRSDDVEAAHGFMHALFALGIDDEYFIQFVEGHIAERRFRGRVEAAAAVVSYRPNKDRRDRMRAVRELADINADEWVWADSNLRSSLWDVEANFELVESFAQIVGSAEQVKWLIAGLAQSVAGHRFVIFGGGRLLSGANMFRQLELYELSIGSPASVAAAINSWAPFSSEIEEEDDLDAVLSAAKLDQDLRIAVRQCLAEPARQLVLVPTVSAELSDE